jgi:hypothetical protein
MRLPRDSKKILNALGVILGALSAITFFIFSNSEKGVLPSERAFSSLLLPVAAFLVAVGLFLFSYLQPDPIINRLKEVTENAEKAAAIAKAGADLASTSFELQKEREGILEEVQSEREGLSVDETAFDSKAEPRDPRERRIGQLFNSTQQRLRQEVEALGTRSNINLVFGVLITIGAIILLVYLVSREHERFQDLKDVLAYYIPRITTIALIETFAYFFLGLYKANLEEIKFYQSERTTIAALEIAWRASLWPEIGAPTADVIQQIVRTDRNRPALVNAREGGSNQADILEIVKSLTKLAGDAAKGKE